MPKITYRTTPIVWIDIKGEEHPDDSILRVRDDGGLIRRLNLYLLEEEIYPAVHTGSGGGGRDAHGYFAEDAEKIVVWLKEQGCEKRRGP